jgi:transcriptional regulator with XRE-family HTH domain
MQVKTMGDLGALVRSARTARGMTQADLAAQLRMSRDWVVRLEKGHPRLEAQRVLDALRVVGVSLEATVPEAPTGRERGTRKPKQTAKDPAPHDPFEALFGTRKT